MNCRRGNSANFGHTLYWVMPERIGKWGFSLICVHKGKLLGRWAGASFACLRNWIARGSGSSVKGQTPQGRADPTGEQGHESAHIPQGWLAAEQHWVVKLQRSLGLLDLWGFCKCYQHSRWVGEVSQRLLKMAWWHRKICLRTDWRIQEQDIRKNTAADRVKLDKGHECKTSCIFAGQHFLISEALSWFWS